MTFTGLSSSNTLRLSRYGSPPAASFQYRLGEGSWTDLPENTNVAVAENQMMQVRAKGGEQRMGSSLNNFRWFQMTGRFKAAGNVMSLLDRSEQLTSVDNYALPTPSRRATRTTQSSRLWWTRKTSFSRRRA